MKKLYIETYGCQMNLNDSEIVRGIMTSSGWVTTETVEDADAILLNTCSVRENAEETYIQTYQAFLRKNSNAANISLYLALWAVWPKDFTRN